MWRALFLAIGIFCCLIGLESMVIDSAVIVRQGARQTIAPPDWAPWILMSAGAVVILYSFTIPKRVRD